MADPIRPSLQGQPSLASTFDKTVMSHLPTLRGWAAVALPLVGGFVLFATFPARFIESGVGTWIQEPVARSTWILSGAFVILCVGSCIEALRRGSRTDKIILCLGALLTFWLIREFFEFMLLRVRPSPI